MHRPIPAVGHHLVESVGNAAHLADRRPHALPIALNAIGDIARRLVSLPGPELRALRDEGESLAALLGTTRATHDRMDFGARDAAIVQMSRLAARVSILEGRLLGGAAPPAGTITTPLPQQPFGRAALGRLHRLVAPEPRPAARLTLIQGGRT